MKKNTSTTMSAADVRKIQQDAAAKAAAVKPRKKVVTPARKAAAAGFGRAVGKGLLGALEVAAAANEANAEFERKTARIGYMTKDEIASIYQGTPSFWGPKLIALPPFDLHDGEPLWHVDTVKAWAKKNRADLVTTAAV